MLAHRAAAGLPVNAPTDPAAVARAAVCCKHPANRAGFRIDPAPRPLPRNSPPCTTVPTIAGRPVFAALTADKELWRLACLAEGRRQGRPMNALAALLGRLRTEAGAPATPMASP